MTTLQWSARILAWTLFVLALSPLAAAAAPPPRQLAVTFDDLPRVAPHQAEASDLPDARRMTQALLQALQTHHVTAVGFVNEGKLVVPGQMDDRVHLLQMWLDAGHTLGNHGYFHLSLLDTPLWRYEDDFVAGQVITSHLLEAAGRHQRYFRYPFSCTGTTPEVKQAFEEFLHQRNYRIGVYTVDLNDPIFNQVYVWAQDDHDSALAARVRGAYLDYVDTRLAFLEHVSRETFGRDIPQVLLLHANDLNAECLDALLARLEARGYSYITLDQALDDPAYQTRDTYTGRGGISWLYHWSFSLGKGMQVDQEPWPPSWVMGLYKAGRPPRPQPKP